MKLLGGLMLAMGILMAAAPAAHAETRTLKLYFLHTKERAEITYKRNGRYIQSGLKEVNRFLRDWRRNEPTNMNPQLLDLLWEVYRASGSRDYIHVISAYRSPQTNAMLRSRSNGVAKKSQHMLGKAIDFYLPDVKLAKLRATALRFNAGGVGYYPRSGSPFVHLDVGSVRHWPRMSRKELLALFPDGKTMHVPTDGKPLPGYKQALAAYESGKRSGSAVRLASTGNDDSGRKNNRGLLATLFGGGADEEEDNADSATTVVASRPAKPVARQAPAPKPEPADTPATILAALPERSLPVPHVAPRPQVGVGQPQSLPFEVKPAEAQPALAEAPNQAPEAFIVADIPLPSLRPDYTPDAVAQDAPVQMASAETSAPDAIANVLAQVNQADAEQPITTAAYLPVPSQRPQLGAEQSFELASLQQPGEEARQTESSSPAAPTQTGVQEEGSPVSASPRMALLAAAKVGSARPAEKLTHTTDKSAKPGPRDVSPTPRPVVVATSIDMKSRALSRQPLLSQAAQVTHPPAFDSEFVRSPNAVYTIGFEQNIAMADATRFTGKAVNFISMAKFRTN